LIRGEQLCNFSFFPPPSAMAATAKKVQIDIVSDIF